MLVCDAHGVRSAERTRNDVGATACDLTNEIGDQFDVEIGGVWCSRWFRRETEAEQVESKDAKVLRELVEVLAPHEARHTRVDAVNEDDRKAGIVEACTGFLVEDLAVLPGKQFCLAAERAVVRVERAALDGSVEGRERGNACASRQQRLPPIP